MSSHVLTPTKEKERLLELFQKMYDGEAILFLGAGASVGSRKYLSAQIMDYYKEEFGIDEDTGDIVEFVDNLSASPSFSRSKFDSFVAEMLGKLQPTIAHRHIMSIPWRQILTTNYDLLLEKAEQELLNSPEKAFDLIPIRTIQDNNFFEDRSQVKYIKLNGCLSDLGKYKLVFSSDDFKRAKRFYQAALKPLQSLSPKIAFITVGYSFSDPLARQLIAKFDSINFRDKKWMHCVDPFVPDYRLPKLEEDRISVIKATGEQFFQLYKEWEEEKYRGKISHRGIKVTNSKNERLSINHKVAHNLYGLVKQLGPTYEGSLIKEKDFYEGEEPNYNVIVNNYDIIKEQKINEVSSDILQELTIAKNINIIRIIFLSGSFGTGKTTSIYRIIHQIISDVGNDVVAFELTEIDAIRESYILSLLDSINSANVIFYCNNVELDSVFKSFLSLRLFLSKEQVNKNIVFVTSIRENILAKHKEVQVGTNNKVINIDTSLTIPEIDLLLDKLRVNQLVMYRDAIEKSHLRARISKEFRGDTFLSLLELVSNGKHIKDLRNAYSTLSAKCKDAFIYTALIHRYNQFMPAGILKNIVSSDWDSFTENVIKVEGRGILIQEQVKSKGVDADLFFRTKHRSIAEKLVTDVLKSKEKRFRYYKKLFNGFNGAPRHGKLAVNLIKALREDNEFDDFKLNTLFDIAASKFPDDPHFLLHYATNLQHRRSLQSLKDAIDLLVHAESLLPRRDHRFIHRRGVINFEIAKLYFVEESELDKTFDYLDEAEELFSIKKQLDPCSSYSYFDYLDLSLWELDNIKLDDDEEVQLKIFIEDSINQAFLVVTDGIQRIQSLFERYQNNYQFAGDQGAYLKELEEQYHLNTAIRPYICVLMLNHFEHIDDKIRVAEIVGELEAYIDDEEIAKILFRYYGRKLYDANLRIKFFELSRHLSASSFGDTLRFNYFNFVAHSYNGHFSDAEIFSRNISRNFTSISPEFNSIWLDPDGSTPRVFSGNIVKSGSRLKFRSRELQGYFRIGRNSPKDFKEGDPCDAELHFFLNGTFAIIRK